MAYLNATPSYLELLGNPTTLDELSRDEFVALDRSEAFINGLRARGLSLTQTNFPWISSNQQRSPAKAPEIATRVEVCRRIVVSGAVPEKS